MASRDDAGQAGPAPPVFSDDVFGDALLSHLTGFLHTMVVNPSQVVMISRPGQTVSDFDVIQPAFRPAFPDTTARSGQRTAVAPIVQLATGASTVQNTFSTDQDYLLARLSDLAAARSGAIAIAPPPSLSDRLGYGWSVPQTGDGMSSLTVSVLGICSAKKQAKCMHAESDHVHDHATRIVVLHFKWLVGTQAFTAVGTYQSSASPPWTICAIECALETVRRYSPSGFMMTGQLTEKTRTGMQPLVPLMLHVFAKDGNPTTVIVDTRPKRKDKTNTTAQEDQLCNIHAEKQMASLIPDASMLNNYASVPVCGGMPENATHDKASVPLVLHAVSFNARRVRVENIVNPVMSARHARTENTAVDGVSPILDWFETTVHKKGEKQNEFSAPKKPSVILEISRCLSSMKGGTGNLALGHASFWQTDAPFRADADAAAAAGLQRQAVAVVGSVAITPAVGLSNSTPDVSGNWTASIANVEDVVVTVRTAVPISYSKKNEWAVSSYILHLDKALLLGDSVPMCAMAEDWTQTPYTSNQYEVHETVFSRVQVHFSGPSELTLLFSPDAMPTVHVAAKFSMQAVYDDAAGAAAASQMQNETCFAPFTKIELFERRSKYRLVHDRPAVTFMVFTSPVKPVIAGQLIVCGRRVCALNCTLTAVEALAAVQQAGADYSVWIGDRFANNVVYSMVPHGLNVDAPGTTVLPDLATQSLQRPEETVETETFHMWSVGTQPGHGVYVAMQPYNAALFLKATVTVSLGTANNMCNLRVFRVQCCRYSTNTVLCRVIAATQTDLSIPLWCFQSTHDETPLQADAVPAPVSRQSAAAAPIAKSRKQPAATTKERKRPASQSPPHQTSKEPRLEPSQADRPPSAGKAMDRPEQALVGPLQASTFDPLDFARQKGEYDPEFERNLLGDWWEQEQQQPSGNRRRVQATAEEVLKTTADEVLEATLLAEAMGWDTSTE